MFNLFNRLPGIVRVLLWMALPPLAAALIGAWAISHHTGGGARRADSYHAGFNH